MVVKVKLYKAITAVILAVGLPAFAAGWVVAVNFSGVFETGYKMAFLDIEAAMKETFKDGQPFFYMHGIRFYNEKGSKCDEAMNVRSISKMKGPEQKHGKVLRIGFNIKK